MDNLKLKYLLNIGVIAGFNLYPDKDGNDVLNIHFNNGDNIVIKASPIGTGNTAELLIDI